MSESKPKFRLPKGYVAPALERVPGGGVDASGMELPKCRPDTHRDDGKHSMMCFAGAIGYRKTPEGDWERRPLHPLDVDGATMTYRGHLYIRPVDRGVVLDDETYLEALPSGDYEARITLTRIFKDPS